MRLSHMETAFWYGCALRVAGIPAGAVYAAIRMIQWADFHHGFGVSYFERRRANLALDPSAMRMIGEHAIDGGGQSSLIVGPAMLDHVTVAAKAHGQATVTAVNMGDLGWLGQLAEQASQRGLAAILSFVAAGPDADDLGAVYSATRTIMALPGNADACWIESNTVSAAHDVLIGGGSLALSATGPSGITPGVALICVDPDHDPNMPDAVRAAARSVDALMLSADDLATRRQDALQRGFEVDDDEWRSLAEYGFGVLAESTERSLRGAGA